MTKITSSFLALVFVIIFSSIIYVWKADEQKRTLESQLESQQKQIAALESQLELQTTPATIVTTGKVQGTTITSTGKITGSVTLSNPTQTEAVVVCLNEIHNGQETCTDFILETTKKKYEFTFDVPGGTYEVYAMLPPIETKVFYSEISTCDKSGDCTSNAEKKRLLEVNQEETQSNIDIYL